MWELKDTAATLNKHALRCKTQAPSLRTLALFFFTSCLFEVQQCFCSDAAVFESIMHIADAVFLH